MNKKITNMATYLGLFSIFIFIILSIYNKANIYFCTSIVLWGLIFIYFFRNEDYFLCGFLFAFFGFLLSGELFYNIFGIVDIRKFEVAVNNHAFISMVIALIGIFLGGFIISIIKNSKNKKGIKEYNNSINNKNGIIWSRLIAILFFISSLFISVLLIIEKINVINDKGFLNSYLGFNSIYPQVFQSYAQLIDVSYAFFLATMPKKRTFYIISFLYIGFSALNLLTFQRMYFFLNYLLFSLYIISRDNMDKRFICKEDIDKKSKWLNWKSTLLIIILAIVIIPTMNYINDLRFGRHKIPGNKDEIKTSISDNLNEIEEIAVNQGFSINVIKWGYKYKDELPNKNYIFGSLIDFVENGSFSSRFLGKNNGWYREGNSVEMATLSHNYAHAISYKVLGEKYLSGRGVGSSYIAEAYHDFGYIGVFLISVLIGVILKFVFSSRSIIILFIGFYTYNYFLKMPRANFDGFLLEFISIKNILFVVIIMLGQYILSNKFKTFSERFFSNKLFKNI